MFLETEKPNSYKDKKEVFGQAPETQDPNSNIFVLLGVIIIIFLVFALAYITLSDKSNNKAQVVLQKNIATTSTGKLPSDISTNQPDEYALGTSTDVLIAENVSFGYFYKKPENNREATKQKYELPLNIKTDVKNYYDASRKINLDKYLDDLNTYGFAVLENQSEITDKDFYSAYHDLANKELPLAITDDFIFYYYQNVFKDVYKEIEKNVFYEHVWRLNKALYDIALTRYKNSEELMGADNNPVLEGQRQQLAYLAMALKLLMPTKEQVSEDVTFSNSNKFTPQEADKYGFVIPDFLRTDIEREYKLISFANKTEKSPIMLYPLDYSKFSIPGNYLANAKLSNFYVTLTWLKNVFPLYYKNSVCEDCLLDKDDWVINMYAGARLARDLNDNQDLKNQWAIIYKFISFFSGLRQDMTYLNYHDNLQKLFGKNYNLEKIFSLDNDGRDNDLQKIQDNLAELQYSRIEGGIDRGDIKNRPFIGMRLLQEDFWPNDYIFKELSNDSIKAKFTKITDNTRKTACSDKKGGVYRCSGFGYDVLSLIKPIDINSEYYYGNIDYVGYTERLAGLRREIEYFNQNTWNNNVYWLTLDILKKILENTSQNKAVYAESSKWNQERSYQTALGAWVNLHLDEDTLVPYAEQETNVHGLGLYNRSCNLNNYIELDVEFIDELIARNVMMIKMLSILKVDKDTNAASLRLKDLNSDLQKLSAVAEKLIKNQAIDDDDCRMLDDFARRNVVDKLASKSFSINSTEKASVQSVEKIKILAMIYNRGNEKILVFGPMFAYKE